MPIVRFPVLGNSGVAYLATSLTSRWVQNDISLKHKQTRGGPRNAFPMAHDSWLPFDMTRINLHNDHPYKNSRCSNYRVSFHISRLIYWKGSLLQLEHSLRVTVTWRLTPSLTGLHRGPNGQQLNRALTSVYLSYQLKKSPIAGWTAVW